MTLSGNIKGDIILWKRIVLEKLYKAILNYATIQKTIQNCKKL